MACFDQHSLQLPRLALLTSVVPAFSKSWLLILEGDASCKILSRSTSKQAQLCISTEGFFDFAIVWCVTSFKLFCFTEDLLQCGMEGKVTLLVAVYLDSQESQRHSAEGSADAIIMVPANIKSRKHVDSLALCRALSSYTASKPTSYVVIIQSILKDCVIGHHHVAIMSHSCHIQTTPHTLSTQTIFSAPNPAWSS